VSSTFVSVGRIVPRLQQNLFGFVVLRLVHVEVRQEQTTDVRSAGVSAAEIALSSSFNASSFFPMIARKRARLV